ncbi:MAG: CDP-diacylglycerol--serine O-phosphatidyltransferase [Oligoflexia bacterium]|nr:CDP-diacylglycerol--serine O-phosphatidyltransferase [Oligoflexia bacterium]
MKEQSVYREELRELVRMRKRGMHVYALPNLLTSMNLLLGFLAILAAVDGRIERAVWTILLAAVFDMLDGRVARLTNTTSKFGVEFDSLCDLISFGLAPSLLMYYASLQPFGRIGVVATVIYALCGALRLARFNVMAEVLPKSYFQGLPIPMASLTICTAVFFAREVGIDLYKNLFFLILTASLGLLMVSTFKFPSFKDIHLRHRKPFTTIAISFVVLICLISWFEIAAFVLFMGYIVISLGLDIARSWKTQWKKK